VTLDDPAFLGLFQATPARGQLTSSRLYSVALVTHRPLAAWQESGH